MRIVFIIAAAITILAGCGENPAASEAEAATNGGRFPVRLGPETQDAERHGLGEVFDFSFTDLSGRTGTLAGHARGRPVVVFVRDATCPIGKRYGPRLSRIDEAGAEKGYGVLYLNPTLHDDAVAMRRDVEQYGFVSPYIADKCADVGRLLGVRSSCEVFLFDASRRMVYRGAVDDQYGFGYAIDEPRKRYLADALAAVAAGRAVAVDATTAPGCFLDMAERPAPAAAGVTFHGRISGIMQERCERCHRPGENGPFPLISYKDVAGRKIMIRHVVRNDIMPPWFANPKVGGPWANDMRLLPDERRDLLAWIESGCPEGDPADAPPKKEWAAGWKIGEPDAVIELPEKLHVPAEGIIPYKHVVVQTTFDEDKWIQGMELQTDLPESVHHILVFYHEDAHDEWSEFELSSLALRGFLTILTPGTEPLVYPDDRAKLLKKGTRLLFQVHYTALGYEAEDRVRLGLKFAPGPPRNPIVCEAAMTTLMVIPPGEPNYVITAEHPLVVAGRLLGFMPHLHLRGKAFRMELVYPDGRVRPLLDVPRFDFNWQQAYRLEDPIDIPAGCKMRATAWYDNSEANPANPDPAQTVRFGLKTSDEMMIGYFEWVKAR